MADPKDEIIDRVIAHDIDLLRFSAGERRQAVKVLRQMEKDLLVLVDRLDEEELALGLNFTDGMKDDAEKILAFVETELEKLGAL